MKIGIITLDTSNNNYGQKLQLYALQTFLARKEVEVWHEKAEMKIHSLTIHRVVKAFNPNAWVEYISSRKRILKNMKVDFVQDRKFTTFEKRWINTLSKCCDIYFVGADQVWNFIGFYGKNFNNFLTVFFLKKYKNVKKISYAASWGSANPKGRYAKKIAECLKDFDYVSVREKDGIDKCKVCGRDDAVVVPDPTLLLQPNDYRELYKDEEFTRKEEPYVFFYYLDNGGKFDKQSVFEWASCKGLNVVYVTANGVVDDYEKCYPTIPQWIWLVEHAEYVVTNSYHGTIFSLLFERKFGSIMLNGENAGMNSRFDTLWEICNVSPRIIEGSDFSILEKPAEKIKVDYTESDKLWAKLKQWDEERSGNKS